MSINSDSSSSSFPREHEHVINDSALTGDRTNLLDHERRLRSRTSCCSLRSVATMLFAFVTVTGQVTQYVTIPLSVDSTTGSLPSARKQTEKWRPTLDSYFVISFASLSFVVLFGSVLVCSDIICHNYLVKTDWRYRRLLLSVGCLNGVAAMFIVFSSSGSRTPPYLQAILGNFSIPVTLILR